MKPTITRHEWVRVSIYAAVLLLVTSLPYVLGWATAGGESVFSGFLFGVDDGNSYLGKMRLGAQGAWAFSLVYTTEPHASAPLLFLPYILPGHIVGLFLEPTDPRLTPALLGTFHLLRVIFGGLLVLVLYRFIAAFMRRGRFLALVLATLGGGFGWLLFLPGDVPPEFFIPEGFSLQILLGLPHLALARAALLGGLLLLFAALDAPRGERLALLAGGCWLVVGLAVPFYLVIIYSVLGAWGLALWLRQRAFPLRLFRLALIAAGLTLPLFLYNVVVFTTNPAFAQWSAQNLLPSPPPLHYVLAYLPLAALAVIGARWAWRRTQSAYALLIGWPLIVPVLVYLPLNVQRRMAEAVIVPLAILAAMGIRLLARRYRRVKLAALLALLPSALILIAVAYIAALSSAPPVKYPAGQIAALNWLNANGEPGAGVLSVFETGNLIPAYTGLRAYVGHGPETLFAIAKTEQAEQFFAGALSATEQADLLAQVRYVFYGVNERRFAADDAPAWADGLREVYRSGAYVIYAVG